MSIYEYHVTVVKQGLQIADWKESVFDNLDYFDNVVSTDILLSTQKKFANKTQATNYVFRMADECLDFADQVTRVKIETGPNSQDHQTLYFEAHFKLKELIRPASLSDPYFVRSVNRIKQTNWATIRTYTLENLEYKVECFREMYRNNIKALEVESVFVDTAPETDYHWFNSNRP